MYICVCVCMCLNILYPGDTARKVGGGDLVLEAPGSTSLYVDVWLGSLVSQLAEQLFRAREWFRKALTADCFCKHIKFQQWRLTGKKFDGLLLIFREHSLLTQCKGNPNRTLRYK